MNGTRTFTLPPALREALDGYRRRRRALAALAGACLTLAVGSAGLGVAVAADRLWRLESTTRAVLLGLLCMALAAGFARGVLWPALRRLSDRRAALRLGSRFPDLGEDLLTAVELSRAGDLPGVSHSLVRSALDEIGRRTGALDWRRAVPARPVLRATLIMACPVALLAAGYALRPEAVRNAVERLLRPGESVPFFSYVKLDVAPGDTVAASGDPVTLRAAVYGRAVKSVRLEAQSGEEAVRLTLPCRDGAAEWTSGRLFQDLRYRMRAGDAIGAWHRVRVVPAPAAARKGAVLRAPPYAESVEREIVPLQGALDVVAGCALSIEVMPLARGDEPQSLCTATMQFAGSPLPSERAESGLLRSPFFQPRASGELTIELEDGWGLRSRVPERVAVQVTPDQPPKVRIPAPGQDVVILPGDRVRIEAAAEDEFGIRALELLSRVTRKDAETASVPWARRVLKTGGPRERIVAVQDELTVEALGLGPGDRLEYRAAAADYAGAADRREGLSPIYRLIVLSEEEHLGQALDRLKELQLQLLRRAAAERVQAEKAAALAARAGATDTPAAAQEAAALERRNARDTESVAADAERLLSELARNPATPVALLLEMEALARDVRAVAQDPIAQAARRFDDAAGSPDSRAESLRQAGAETGRAAERLEEIAKRTERMQRQALLEKLAEEAERLAARQRALRETVRPFALRTAGRKASELSEPERKELEELVGDQARMRDEIQALRKGLDDAVNALTFSSPSDAATAQDAAARLSAEKTAERAGGIAEAMAQNTLLRQMPEQEAVAESLGKVAETLRQGAQPNEIERYAQRLDQFIARQKTVNAEAEKGAAGGSASAAESLGARQQALGDDVSDHAAALRRLAEELERFEPKTAGRLEAAAQEMASGAGALRAQQWPQGLDHGRRALARLEEAQQTFTGEQGAMGEAGQNRADLEAMLLLQRTLIGQQRVRRGTEQADALKASAPIFRRAAGALAQRQGDVREDAGRLGRMLARFPRAAELTEAAGAKMEASGRALAAGDTGASTQGAQEEAIALLEQLMASQGGGSGRGGQGGGRGMALMRMMGGSGGGYTGGSNAPVAPQELGGADARWLETRARFEGALGAGAEGRYPPEFRDLLTRYFDGLRKAARP